MTDDRDMRDVPLHVSRRSLLERARRAVADRFHDLDDRVSRQRGRRRRLLFEAANPMLFNVFAPVYDRLRQDRRIEITLMAHGEEWAPQEIFAGADSRIV